MAKRHKAPSIIAHPFEIFNKTELIQKSDHQFIGAFLRYIVDKHFLPDLVLRSH
jgi:hypothetical protein